jgi:uncharacterized protein YneF (UPF0154 family)
VGIVIAIKILAPDAAFGCVGGFFVWKKQMDNVIDCHFDYKF